LNDILPDTLTRGIPRLVEEAPNLLRGASSLARTLPEKGAGAVGFARELAQDPSALQYNLDTVRKEIRNIYKSTPEGLYTPPFEVLKKTGSYEVRSYGDYAVCSTVMGAGKGESASSVTATDPLASGTSFSELANYIFTEGQMAMTTPVIVSEGNMQFVLPRGVTADNAPAPSSSAVSLLQVPAEVVAAREFPGFATDGEVGAVPFLCAPRTPY